MHCFRDAPSLHQYLNACPSPQLQRLVHAHLMVLAAFDDVPIGDLAHFFILEQGDSANILSLTLGRNLRETPIETCLSHSEWFELVIIVSDDGFGYVVFIPKTIEDQSLVDFCVSQSTRALEDGS